MDECLIKDLYGFRREAFKTASGEQHAAQEKQQGRIFGLMQVGVILR